MGLRMKRGNTTTRDSLKGGFKRKLNKAYCDNHIVEYATYFNSDTREYLCKNCYNDLSTTMWGKTIKRDIDFIDNKITSFYVKWSDLKERIHNCAKKHESGIKNYKKFIKYLSNKFSKPLLFPDITDERLMNQWEHLFKKVTVLCQRMHLKELIDNDNEFTKFHRRIKFYENSWDITKSIGSYLNSSDVKKVIDEEGPYWFKDLTSQDQLVLIKLQYEGKISEMQETIDQQKNELDRYRANPDHTSKWDF